MKKLMFIEMSFVSDMEIKFTRLLPVEAIAFLDTIVDNSEQFRIFLKDHYLKIASSCSINNYSETNINKCSIEIIK